MALTSGLPACVGRPRPAYETDALSPSLTDYPGFCNRNELRVRITGPGARGGRGALGQAARVEVPRGADELIQWWPPRAVRQRAERVAHPCRLLLLALGADHHLDPAR